MTPVMQTIIDAEYGNCFQATIASLLDLPLEAVPHFLRSEELWHDVYTAFMWAHGWDWKGDVSGHGEKEDRPLKAEETVNGHYYASVRSRVFKGGLHAVVMDLDGVIVHDPNPESDFTGDKVYGTDELASWALFSPRGDGWADYSHVKKWLERQNKGKKQ